jgi:outer membrane protein assembly factor BamA
VEGYYGLASRRANILFQYVYDGLFPTLSFSFSDNVEYSRDHDDSWRTREFKLASLWPLRLRKRSQLHAYADLHLERRTIIDAGGVYENTGSFNGFRFGLSFNTAREYYDSVSPSDGGRVVLQGTLHPAGLGNQWASRSVQADLRHYIPLLRPGVLAWRLALARSWGAGNLAYDMGGREIGNGLGDSPPFRLLRGFDLGSFRGDRGWQFNMEYRLPLFKIEKALLPAVSLDRVWLNAFLDSGRLSGSHYSYPTAHAAGAETVLRLAVGGAGYTDLALGAAYGFGPERQYWVYLRTGRSF